VDEPESVDVGQQPREWTEEERDTVNRHLNEAIGRIHDNGALSVGLSRVPDVKGGNAAAVAKLVTTLLEDQGTNHVQVGDSIYTIEAYKAKIPPSEWAAGSQDGPFFKHTVVNSIQEPRLSASWSKALFDSIRRGKYGRHTQKSDSCKIGDETIALRQNIPIPSTAGEGSARSLDETRSTTASDSMR
jgi:hypothetical protein